MENEIIQETVDSHLEMLHKALSKEPITIGHIHREKPAELMFPGVYFISHPNDEKIVYVGKTRTNTLLKRIFDHRTIGTKSDLKGMVKNNPNIPQEVDSYLVRSIRIEDDRERGFFEYFAIGVLKPKLNK